MSRHYVTVTVNGERQQAEVDARKLLVHFLRDDLGVTSTHVGCDTTQCGACTVHLDGRAVKSCTILAVQADGAAVDTVEALSKADNGEHPLLSAFREHHALQCGFCTPGMTMSSLELVPPRTAHRSGPGSAPAFASAQRNSKPAASRSAALHRRARCSRDAQSAAAAR